jgi:hypothetical protein
MNCRNHPDVPAAAYCQSCGKPLCTACMRSVGGSVFCEPCLAARLSATQGSAFPDAPVPGIHAHPVLAGLLGFIPGVGAMYNGQFVKALAHVLIFAVFVSLSDKSVVFGLLVAAWVFYQVFDAAQTAKARRDGLPLPNPFGLNDLGAKLGMAPTPAASPYAAGFTPPASPPPASAGPGQNPAAGAPFPSPPPSYPSASAPDLPAAGTPPYGPPIPFEPRTQRYPMGAVVLIVIGAVLLLQTLGIFEDEWIGRAWPLIIIGIGVWLLYRKTRGGLQ